MEEQRTLGKEFSLEGTGLQTGKDIKITFCPAEENRGITFKRIDIKDSSDINLQEAFDFDTDRRSKIGSGKVFVETVEHVLAALWGAGIDNVTLEMNSSEPPAMDGSAALFLSAIKKAGIEKQKAPKDIINIKEPIWVESGESFLGIFPSEDFKISYLLEYKDSSIGRQFFSSSITEDIFEKEIASARTFCLKEEAEALKKMGYGKGANFENTLVMDKEGPINNSLRFSDEPVRHKVLDLIGDLYILGCALKGRIIAVRSGHKLNLELVKKIKKMKGESK